MASSAALTLTFMVLATLNLAHFYVINVTTEGSTDAGRTIHEPDSKAGDLSNSRRYDTGANQNDTEDSEPYFAVQRLNMTLVLQGNNSISQSYSETNNISRPDLLKTNITSVPVYQTNDGRNNSSASVGTNSTCNDTSKNCTTRDKVETTDFTQSAQTTTNNTVVYETYKENKTLSVSEDFSSTRSNISRKEVHDNSTVFVLPNDTKNSPSANTSQVIDQSADINTTVKTTTLKTTTLKTTTLKTTTSLTTPTTPRTTTTAVTAHPKWEKGRKRHGNTGRKSSSTSKTSTSSQGHHLAKHFTGFVQHVWLPNSTPRQPGPADEGPFGSILWKDKKYLISVLIPIGVGFAGAMMIIVMAYASRAWRKRKERYAQEHGAPRSFLEAATSKNDDTAPLQESSDDEF
ncbi:uncharacterized protein [Littorina saxatilis]|uniref:uncharacterized protein n=1 Tax=Littorina saxatilis TaxID=31220 RepID=UPI0038B64E51